jgi:3-phosphoshikimate 1-carboxyvinyltransferase
MIDEVPAACALAAASKGSTEIRDAAELRVKESDRIATMAEVLRAFGAPCEELPDGLVITGGAALRGAHIDSRGDHRIAMAAALLGLLADGETVIEGAQAVDTSFPGFVALMRSLGADITEEA